jgi:nucleoside-diphosphate-sugar epimerase
MLHNSIEDPQEITALVSGSSSGLGKNLREVFHATAFRRGDNEEELARLKKRNFQMIIHCAMDARKEFSAVELPEYVSSNLTLTERLLEIPHDCFVYVSSHAVYPADGQAHSENEALTVSQQISIYGIFKLLSEQLALRRSPWPLILRCSSLVGEEGRPNNIMKILRKQGGPVFLSGNCPYNLIAYEQVAEFLRMAHQSRISGIFNLGSSDWRSLSDITSHLGVPVDFGKYLYAPPLADLRKVQDICPAFRKSTLAVASEVSRKLAGGQQNPLRTESC